MLGLALIQNKEYPEGIKHLEKVTVHFCRVPSFFLLWVEKNQMSSGRKLDWRFN